MQPQPTGLIYAYAALEPPLGKGDRQKDGQQVYTWIASTARPDGNGNIFDLQGWELETYRKNPIVMAAHNWGSLPVAKTVYINIDIAKQALIAQIVFATTPTALEIQQLVDGGFLCAMSAGALPIESEPRFDDQHHIIGTHYHRQSMRELSLVPVPANTETLRIASLLADRDEAQAIRASLHILKETLWTTKPSI